VAVETPVVRYFVACRQAEVEPGTNEVTLRRLIHAIVRLPGEDFPVIRPEMALYAVLTNGRGPHDFSVEFTFLDQGEERTVFPPPPSRRIDLGQDPTVVRGLPIPLRNVVFRRPGQYTFYLLVNGQRLAEAHFEVR
jgi:hypothetical protein